MPKSPPSSYIPSPTLPTFSPHVERVIRARWDGRMETARVLAQEAGVGPGAILAYARAHGFHNPEQPQRPTLTKEQRVGQRGKWDAPLATRAWRSTALHTPLHDAPEPSSGEPEYGEEYGEEREPMTPTPMRRGAASEEEKRVCRTCRVEKALTEDNFGRHAGTRDGWAHTCRPCLSQAHAHPHATPPRHTPTPTLTPAPSSTDPTTDPPPPPAPAVTERALALTTAPSPPSWEERQPQAPVQVVEVASPPSPTSYHLSERVILADLLDRLPADFSQGWTRGERERWQGAFAGLLDLFIPIREEE